MEMFKRLKATCDDLSTSSNDPIRFREQVDALHAGISQIETVVLSLEDQVKKLQARRDALEAQVMDMATKPEPPPDWWDNVIFVYDDEDDADWDSDPDPVPAA